MNWLTIAIISYLILAIVNLADKFLIDNAMPNSKAYTFLVGVLGSIVILAGPWFMVWPGTYFFAVNLIVGALFPLALLLLYRSLKTGDVSRVLVLIGGSVPVFIVIFSSLFLGERFTTNQWIGIISLIVGTMIIAWMPQKHSLGERIISFFRIKREDKIKGTLLALSAGFVFALFFIGTKYAYNNEPFGSAFIWIRIGSLITVLTFLLHKKTRRGIIKSIRKLKGKNRGIFFSNQVLSAIGFSLQNYAIALGSVVLVSSLQGIQYGFLLILGVLITIFKPHIVKENISRNIILQKVVAIILISIGLYFIAI